MRRVADPECFMLRAAIIPLAKLLGFGTEELSIRVGQTLGGVSTVPPHSNPPQPANPSTLVHSISS